MERFNKIAFTLAETLIVIGIIGVVAALTLPNLNSSTGDKEKVVKLKKIYSELEDVVGRAQVVYGPINNWCSELSISNLSNCEKKHFERLTEFIKYSKICTSSDACSEFQTNPNHSVSIKHNYAIVLQDGTTIGFGIPFIPYILDVATVDIDGNNKGSNSRCDDTFRFYFNKNGVINTTNDEAVDLNDYNSCGVWVLLNENMDYLKCNSKLKFGKNTTCK